MATMNPPVIDGIEKEALFQTCVLNKVTEDTLAVVYLMHHLIRLILHKWRVVVII